LWLGITWPSAILTLIVGPWLMYEMGYFRSVPSWLEIKLLFVLGLYAYHFTLHQIYRQQSKGVFKYTSGQLRIWNEVATIFLVSIVMLVVVKQELSFVWGLAGFVLFVVLLISAVRVYKLIRSRR
jgi:putative membrane protein